MECVIDKAKIEETKKQIEADGYAQVSAMKREGVNEVFELAMRRYFKQKTTKKERMCILL